MGSVPNCRKRFSCVTLLGGLSVNLNHLKIFYTGSLQQKHIGFIIFTVCICSMREVTVFTGVCLVTFSWCTYLPGGGYPPSKEGGTYLGRGVPTLAEGYLPSQMGLPTLVGGRYLPWQGVPTLAGGTYLGGRLPTLAGGFLLWWGVLTFPACACYMAGGMPLAFMQEDFLLNNKFTKFRFTQTNNFVLN